MFKSVFGGLRGKGDRNGDDKYGGYGHNVGRYVVNQANDHGNNNNKSDQRNDSDRYDTGNNHRNDKRNNNTNSNYDGGRRSHQRQSRDDDDDREMRRGHHSTEWGDEKRYQSLCMKMDAYTHDIAPQHQGQIGRQQKGQHNFQQIGQFNSERPLFPDDVELSKEARSECDLKNKMDNFNKDLKKEKLMREGDPFPTMPRKESWDLSADKNVPRNAMSKQHIGEAGMTTWSGRSGADSSPQKNQDRAIGFGTSHFGYSNVTSGSESAKSRSGSSWGKSSSGSSWGKSSSDSSWGKNSSGSSWGDSSSGSPWGNSTWSG